MLALLAAFLLGVLHGLGPDHAAAISHLALRAGGLRPALGAAARFALGHGAVFALGALFAGAVAAHVPERLDSAMEIAGGAALALMGLFGLFGVHLHWHRGPRLHRHAREGHTGLDAGLGALFALSGVRSLALSGPWAGRGATGALAVAVAFAAGVLGSMSALAVLLGGLWQAWPARRAHLQRAAAAVALCVGCAWVAAHAL